MLQRHFPACLLLTSLFALTAALPCNARDRLLLTQLKVEGTEEPLAIESERPQFGWQMRTEKQAQEFGHRQTAYRIVVRNEEKNIVWDSGKRKGVQAQHIAYEGQKLRPESHYDWELTVWGEHKRALHASSWFETGIMSPNEGYEGWEGAQWIGGGDDSRMLYAPYFIIFRLNFSLQIDAQSHSTKAAFVYGAKDERLMDRNKNLFQLANDNHRIKMVVDLQGLKQNGTAQVALYRIGYAPQDREEQPQHSFSIPTNILNKDNCYAAHRYEIASSCGRTQIIIDDQLVGECHLNPVGQSHDFIAFPALCHIGYEMEPQQKAFFGNVRVRNWRAPWNTVAHVGDWTDADGGETGKSHLTDPSHGSMPLLRTTFRTKSLPVRHAKLFVTARGIYDAYLNGQRIGKDYFNPGLTQYNKTHLYQAFDVTPFVHKGENAFGAQLGEGWWSGYVTYAPDNWNYFGDRQSLLAKLVITYEDGTRQVVKTDPSTWKYSTESPVVYGSFFQGEVYDATREELLENWTCATYDDHQWKNAEVIPLEGNTPAQGEASDYSRMRLLAENGPSVWCVEKLRAQHMEEIRPGVFIYDMGQNMAAVPEIHLNGMKAGQRLTLRFSEVKYPDLPAYKKHAGMIMLENIRAAMAQDIYIARGGHEIFSPRYTYHGFRYIEITGLEKPLPLDSVQACALSSLHEITAHYETSNEKVNRLWENITWSARSNLLSIPTDCPQRNERMGWAGDISVFSCTATYLGDVSQFLNHYLQAMRDLQTADGRMPDVAPVGGGFGGLLWGSAGITVPWECYQQYADTALLRTHYGAMKRYMAYVREHYIDPETNILVQTHAPSDLGDWLGLEDRKNDKSLLFETYYIYDLQLMEKMARVIKQERDAEEYHSLLEERKAHFRRTYLDPTSYRTRVSAFMPDREGELVDIQTSYVLPLAFHIVDDSIGQRALTDNLVQTIARPNTTDDGKPCPPYSLMTGFIGTAWINRGLSEQKRNDVAYKLLTQTSYPSWLYSVEQGATTIWERLNSYTHTDGFGGNNSMNSFNHYSFGAVGSWMLNYSLGIQRDESRPGFQHFILAPQPDPTGNITWAKGHYESPYGRIESSYRQEGEGVIFEFSVPANTQATLRLPFKAKLLWTAGRPIRTRGDGYCIVAQGEEETILELLAGHHVFVAKVAR